MEIIPILPTFRKGISRIPPNHTLNPPKQNAVRKWAFATGIKAFF